MAKKTKEEPGILQHTLISPKDAKALQRYPYASKITIEDEDIFLAERKKWISKVETMRTEWNLPTQWQEDRDQYNGVTEYKDFPWEDCSSLFIHITSMTVDVVKTKAKAQMFVNPMMLCKPVPGQIGENLYEDINLKEEYVNHKALNEIGIEDKLDPVLEDAINIGTGICKEYYDRRIDYNALTSRIYEATKEDIENFELDFKKDKGTAEYNAYHKDLEKGIPVEVWLYSDEVDYDNPVLSHVELEDLYVRPDVPFIGDQLEIAERVRFSWTAIVNHVKTGYFNLGKKVIEDLKAKYPKDYWNRNYEGFETICYYDYEKTDTPKRIVVTYLEDENRLLRAITFPYIHRKPYYIFYYIKRCPNSIYGDYGMARRLKHTNKALNTLWNQTIDSGTLRNAPVFKAIKDSGFDPAIKAWGPAKIWWVSKMTDVDQFQTMGSSVEMESFIARLERYCEWQTGVSAYATGRESPSDPNAPASKAYMLLKESNLRINDYIKQLHRSNVEVFEQMDKLIYQHMKGTRLPYVKGFGESLETVPITKKTLGIKVSYIPQLSDITINKEQQKQSDMAFGALLMSIPMIQAVPTAQRTILEIQVRNQGGQWEKNIDKILPPVPKPAEAAAAQPNVAAMPGPAAIPNIPEAAPGAGTIIPEAV